MYGNLPAGDLERDLHTVAQDRYSDLGPGRSLHAPDHAVLREFHAGNDLVVDAQEPVAREHADLLRRASGNDFQHYGGIVRDVELDAYAVEIACQVRFGLLKLRRRHVNRVGIELGQGGGDRSVSHALVVHRVHIHLIHLLQDKVQLAPVLIPGIEVAGILRHLLDGQDEQRAEGYAQYGHPDR